MKKCNNKGTTLVNVIVTCGFIGILASVIILATAGNIFIKRIDVKSKNNFYSAETIIKEIEMGLQGDIAEIMGKVYDREIKSGQRDNEDFKKHVLNGMAQDAIGEKIDGFVTKVALDIGNNEIDKDILIAYLDSGIKPLSTVSGINTDDKILYEKDVSGKGDFVIKGLKATFKKDDYVSEISTDINIVIPNMPTKVSTNDRMIEEFKKYAIIANKSVSPVASMNYTVNGDIWVGEGDTISDKGGIQVNHSNTSVSIDENLCERVFSQGEINVVGSNNSSIRIGNDTNNIAPTIATGGLRVNDKDSSGNTGDKDNLYINSKKCIVQNDLSLDGKKSRVSVKGNYYGFGVGDTTDMTLNAKTSSSISVGGLNSILNMTLGTLGLEGCAYVSTNSAKASDDYIGTADGIKTGADILTGESITIRGNQVAYLLPFKYTPFIGNPITKTEYKKYIDDTCQKENKNENVVKQELVESINDKLLEDPYISEYLDDNKPFITMFHKKDEDDEGSIYYYYNFKSKEDAARYYREQVIDNQDDQKDDKDTLAKLIPSDITIDSDFYNIAGNYVTRVNSNTQTFEANGTEDENYASADFSGIFNNLKSFYSEKIPFDTQDASYDSDTSIEKPVASKNAIENTIKHVRDNTNPQKLILGDFTGYDYDSMVIDPSGKGKSVSTLKGNVKVWVENNYSTSLTVPDGYKGLIIASGNVELEGDMTGLLLTFGKVTFKNGGTITADKVMLDGILSKAKSIKTEAGNHCLADLFKLKIVSNSSSGTVTTSTKKKTLSAYDDMVVSLDGMFSHSNWKKVQDS